MIFAQTLLAKKGLTLEIAEGQKKKVRVQMRPSEQFFFQAGHPLLLTLVSFPRYFELRFTA